MIKLSGFCCEANEPEQKNWRPLRQIQWKQWQSDVIPFCAWDCKLNAIQYDSDFEMGSMRDFIGLANGWFFFFYFLLLQFSFHSFSCRSFSSLPPDKLATDQFSNLIQFIQLLLSWIFTNLKRIELKSIIPQLQGNQARKTRPAVITSATVWESRKALKSRIYFLMEAIE